MRKTHNVELAPTDDQRQTLERTIDVCTFVYNLYIEQCKEIYEGTGKSISGKVFIAWLNRKCSDAPFDSFYYCIGLTSDQAVRNTIYSAERAFANYMKDKDRIPKYRSLHTNKTKIYFSCDKNFSEIACANNKIYIPSIGRIDFKSAINLSNCESVSKGWISRKDDKYFITFYTDIMTGSD